MPEARADKPSRTYRVLARDEQEQGAVLAWLDYGEHPGGSQEAALAAAEKKHPKLKKAVEAVAVASGSFEPRERKEKMIPKVTWESARAATQEALDA